MQVRMMPRFAVAAAAAATMFVAAAGANAATVVNVQLTDKGLTTEMATGLAYATPGANMSHATASVKLSRTSVPAGDVSFNVVNMSEEMIHEMLVVPVRPGAELPYAPDENAVDEEKVDSKGEVSELDPGKTGTLTVNLKPGTYLLFCNVPGHFDAGMWAMFTVT